MSVTDKLIAINKLANAYLPEVGVVKHATHELQPATRASYTSGTEMKFRLKTAGYVDAYKSWLQFSIQGTTGSPTFGVGSALNVIRNIRVFSKDGTEISRLQNANLYQFYKQSWSNENNWATQIGTSQGYAASDLTREQKFAIPLRYISPFFDQKKLISPMLLNDMKIEIDLANVGQAIVSVTTPATEYTITNPRMRLHTSYLDPKIDARIKQLADSTGLILYHKEIHHEAKRGNNTSYNFGIQKAVSKGMSLAIIPRLVDSIDSTTNLVDGMSSEIFNFNKIQCSIGSNHFPSQPLDCSPSDPLEPFIYSLQAWDRLSGGESPPNVTYSNEVDTADTYIGVLHNSKASITFNFNKSNLRDHDGYSINDSRQLNINLDMVAANRQLDCYLRYIRGVQYVKGIVRVLD